MQRHSIPEHTRVLQHWNATITAALDARDHRTLRAVSTTIGATESIFVGVGKVRARQALARAEAGARWIGGRRHA